MCKLDMLTSELTKVEIILPTETFGFVLLQILAMASLRAAVTAVTAATVVTGEIAAWDVGA